MYYLVYGLLYLVSLLPMRMLYLVSDLACWLIFGVFGYRIKVVKMNLALALPDKSEEERERVGNPRSRQRALRRHDFLAGAAAVEVVVVDDFGGVAAAATILVPISSFL